MMCEEEYYDEDYIEEVKAMMWVDAWKNGDFEEDEDEV